jgi:prepilin-type N-terminal cleavage/methylation domain-containing protein
MKTMIHKRSAQRGQGGFTLIELLVVIAILAVLGGVAVFAVGNLTDDADKSACQVEKSTFTTANAAAKAKGGTNLPEGYLDAGSIEGETTALVQGKYWELKNSAPLAAGPVVKGTAAGTPITLPTGCS